MAKMLSQRDFDFSAIGTKFELDEVTPVFETEHRADKNGEIITDRDGKPRNFQTDKLIGYNIVLPSWKGFSQKIYPSESIKSRVEDYQ